MSKNSLKTFLIMFFSYSSMGLNIRNIYVDDTLLSLDVNYSVLITNVISKIDSDK